MRPPETAAPARTTVQGAYWWMPGERQEQQRLSVSSESTRG
ncbi:hypothetical protein [Nonomuraea sp. NPDC049725]